MSERTKILIADDDEKILYAFSRLLEKDNFEEIIAHDGKEAIERAEEENPELIFLDISMPNMDGLEAMKKLRNKIPGVPVIIITGAGNMQTAVQAIQSGAFDYLTKPLDLDKVREVIRRAYLSKQAQPVVQKEIRHFNVELHESYEIIGSSSLMQEVYKMIGSISITPNQIPVLITGESGTGKELVARAIHNNSANASKPFIAINCTAMPDTLLESELFGHERGAFTGAFDVKIGKFEAAGSGSIFLDEIGSISVALQQKILRVIQQREMERVGGLEIIPVKARFIAATNTDILDEVRKGTFREDLFYRLNVAAVYLPPLRYRREDITELAEYFLAKYNYRLKKNIRGFSDQVIEQINSYDFPGNVRELENLIERAVMLTKGEVILPEAVGEIKGHKNSFERQIPIISEVFSKSREYILQKFEKDFLKMMLSKYKGSISNASAASKMTRQNFQRLMKKYSLKSSDFKRIL